MSIDGSNAPPAATTDAEAAQIEAQTLPEEEGQANPDAMAMPISSRPDGSFDLQNLKWTSQQDNDGDTVGQQARCSCNTTVACLLAHGKDATLKGLQGAEGEIQKKIDDPAMPPEGKLAWGKELQKLKDVEQHVNDGSLTTKDVDEFASTLYQTFAPKKIDPETHKDVTEVIPRSDIVRMQQTVGLNPTLDENNSRPGGGSIQMTSTGRGGFYPSGNTVNVAQFRSAQAKLASDAFGSLKPGDTAACAVYNGTDPVGGLANHEITIGKDKNGQPFVYDSLGSPNCYMTGADAQKYLSARVSFRGDEDNQKPLPPDRQGNARVEVPVQAVLPIYRQAP
jgi:hypothetical protein